MAEGRSNAGIAERLVLTVGAVEKHIASIFAKLRCRRRTATTAACSQCSPTSEAPPAESPPRLRAELRQPCQPEGLTRSRAMRSMTSSTRAASATGSNGFVM